MELREPPEVGEEASALERQVIRQRRRDDRRLLHVEAVGGPRDDRVAARERVDGRRHPQLGSAELEVAAVLLAVREHVVEDQPDRRIELRWEGLVRSGERGLHPTEDLLGHLPLQAFLVRRRRAGRRSGRGRRLRLLRAQLVDHLLLLLDLTLELLELPLQVMQLAPQLLERHVLGPDPTRTHGQQRCHSRRAPSSVNAFHRHPPLPGAPVHDRRRTRRGRGGG